MTKMPIISLTPSTSSDSITSRTPSISSGISSPNRVKSTVTFSEVVVPPPKPEEEGHSFGIFQKKLEAPIGFYRERDKYYHLKRQYAKDSVKLGQIKEMWNARQLYQLRKRFQWPPKFLFGKHLYWTSGYYDDFWKKRHAQQLHGPSGQWKKVQVDDPPDPDSSDEDDEAKHQPPKTVDKLDWSTIYNWYKAWKTKLLNRRRVSPADLSPDITFDGDMDGEFFRNELKDVEFDPFEETFDADLRRGRASIATGLLSRKKVVERNNREKNKAVESTSESSSGRDEDSNSIKEIENAKDYLNSIGHPPVGRKPFVEDNPTESEIDRLSRKSKRQNRKYGQDPEPISKHMYRQNQLSPTPSDLDDISYRKVRKSKKKSRKSEQDPEPKSKDRNKEIRKEPSLIEPEAEVVDMRNNKSEKSPRKTTTTTTTTTIIQAKDPGDEDGRRRSRKNRSRSSPSETSGTVAVLLTVEEAEALLKARKSAGTEPRDEDGQRKSRSSRRSPSGAPATIPTLLATEEFEALMKARKSAENRDDGGGKERKKSRRSRSPASETNGKVAVLLTADEAEALLKARKSAGTEPRDEGGHRKSHRNSRRSPSGSPATIPIIILPKKSKSLLEAPTQHQ